VFLEERRVENGREERDGNEMKFRVLVEREKGKSFGSARKITAPNAA
jgi:hypothetical protein